MDEIVHTTKQYDRGLVGKIVYDSSPQPYDGDIVCEIAYLKSSRYYLGTQGVSEGRMDEIRDGIADGSLVGLPVFAYVHSGVTIRTSPFGCPWDSGQSGFAYCTRERALEEFNSVEDALKCIEGEVKLFDAYLAGDVFGWVLEDEDGNTIDSCWGYYGDDEVEYMLSELDSAARSHIDDLVEQEFERTQREAEEEAERSYWAERDVVTSAA